MSEIDKVVQASAAGAEESASASEQLSSQALQMKEFAGELMELVNGRSGRHRQAGERADTLPAAGHFSGSPVNAQSVRRLTGNPSRFNGDGMDLPLSNEGGHPKLPEESRSIG